MLNIFEKIRFGSLLSVFVLVFVGTSSAYLQTPGENTENQAPEWIEYFEPERREAIENVVRSPAARCFPVMTEAFDLELAAFFFFLEENFLSEKSNTSLTNLAISRYAEFSTRLNRIFTSIMDDPALEDERWDLRYVGVEQLESCRILKDEYLDLAKQKMMEHIKNNQAQKRSFMIIDKYKSINSGLRDLNMQIAGIFGAFAEFRDRLPFFSSECIQN